LALIGFDPANLRSGRGVAFFVVAVSTATSSPLAPATLVHAIGDPEGIDLRFRTEVVASQTMNDAVGTPTVTAPNAETTEAWDGPLFDRFVRFRAAMTPGLNAQSDSALEVFAPLPGQRVLDIGCGFGDTTRQLAGIVGTDGEAVGVDVSPRFIASAAADAAAEGLSNTRFEVVDVQSDDLGAHYDFAFSRFGTMFFDNPVAALSRVRGALAPGGRLVMVVWRERTDNDWLYRGQTIVEGIVKRPDEYEEPTCGPGPFSMAGADTTSGILLAAGFEEVALHRRDLPMTMGRDLEEAVEAVMSIGPGGEILRLAGDRAADRLDEVRAAVSAGMAEFEGPEGISAPASVWVVTAVAPG
jgi:SAM-dependent methyltransferase